MKLSKFLLGGAALVLAASCSNDLKESLPGGSHQGGDGYISVKVNLPQAKTSRATNDNFDDGTQDEYNVKDMCLIIFQGDTEAKAKQIGAYDLDDYNKTEWENDWNVTDSYQYTRVVPVKNIRDGISAWGLVLVNYKNVGEIRNDEAGTPKFYVGNKEMETLADFNTNVVNTELSKFVSDDYFFMANTVASVNPGSSYDPTTPAVDVRTLVKMDDALWDTPEQAKNAPSANFFVERAVAKATLTKPEIMSVQIPTSGVTGTNTAGKTIDKVLTIQELTWGLDNCEPTSFIVRNAGDVNTYLGYANEGCDADYKYRFAGDTRLGKNINSLENIDLYRTYWAKDPTYPGDKLADDYAKIVYEDAEQTIIKSITPAFKMIEAGTSTASATPLYCHENTFDVAHQNHQNTTRAVVAVKMNGGDTFWTVNDNQDKIYVDATSARMPAVNYIVSSSYIYDAVYEALATVDGKKTEFKNVASIVEVQFNRDENGILKVSKIGFTENLSQGLPQFFAKEPVLSADNEKALKDNVNALFKICEYKNGVSYYNIWIRHFAGDKGAKVGEAAYDLAPWTDDVVDENVVKTTSTIADNCSYPGTEAERENKWLGRYGMVRNNWYDINVNKIQHLGTPEITNVNVDKTPDDEKDEQKWISFTINILSWAKRTQSHDL